MWIVTGCVKRVFEEVVEAFVENVACLHKHRTRVERRRHMFDQKRSRDVGAVPNMRHDAVAAAAHAFHAARQNWAAESALTVTYCDARGTM